MRLAEALAAHAPIDQTTLAAQKHFELAFAATANEPQHALAEFSLGLDSVKQARHAQSLSKDVDRIMLELQAVLQRENEKFLLVSKVMRERHEAAKRTIASVR